MFNKRIGLKLQIISEQNAWNIVKAQAWFGFYAKTLESPLLGPLKTRSPH